MALLLVAHRHCSSATVTRQPSPGPPLFAVTASYGDLRETLRPVLGSEALPSLRMACRPFVADGVARFVTGLVLRLACLVR